MRHRRRSGRIELRGGREGGCARVGELEPGRPGAVGRRRLRLGGHLRRDRVPEEEDDGPPDHRAEARPLLARDDTRSVRLGPLAREPDAHLDRARRRQAAQRPAPARALAEPAHVGPPGRRGGRTPGLAHHRRRAAGVPRGAEPRRCLPPLGRPHARLQRPAAWAELHGLQLRTAAWTGRAGDARGRVPARARPFSRHRPHPRRPLRRARPRPSSSTVCSRTTAISRSGRTRRCGKRRSGCGPTHGRRTARSSRSRPGCARRVASSTTSRHRRPAVRRRSRTSSPRASAATASISPARWR